MLGVIDYGGGNIQSVCNALENVGGDPVRVKTPTDLKNARALVFPGQGAFGDCMGALERQELSAPLRDWLRAGRPFFGICIGYQVLFESSEENPGVAGLGVYKGVVRKFPSGQGLKIPHMGWNGAKVRKVDEGLWSGLGQEPYFYFVHSYFPAPDDASLMATETGYGVNFASAIERGDVVATQFHPEKSQDVGLRLLGNFVRRHIS